MSAAGPETPGLAEEPAFGSNWGAVTVAALTLVIILIVCYMCVQLFKARRPAGLCPLAFHQKEGFHGWVQYRPACSGQWLSERRAHCKGLTTGEMPSIENDIPISWEPCCGSLGVPPPVYQ